jgi:HK97 gp10 family phage protein
MASVTVQNRERLRAKARAMQARVGASIFPAVVKAAEVIIATQKNLVPVDDGELRDSIHWEKASTAQNEARVNIIAGGTEAPYARIIEFGTVSHPRIRFFFPGYRIRKKQATAIIAKAVRAAVRSAAR